MSRTRCIKQIATKVRQESDLLTIIAIPQDILSAYARKFWNCTGLQATEDTSLFRQHLTNKLDTLSLYWKTIRVCCWLYFPIVSYFPTRYPDILHYSSTPSIPILLVWCKVVRLSGETPLDWVLTGCSNDSQNRGAGATHTHICTHTFGTATDAWRTRVQSRPLSILMLTPLVILLVCVCVSVGYDGMTES